MRFALPDLNTLPADIQARIVEVQEKSGFIPYAEFSTMHRCLRIVGTGRCGVSYCGR
jgi:hypothetical protein